MDKPKKRTPSPRVIAAMLLEHIFEGAYFKSAAEMSDVADSKVSDAKRELVIKQLDKMTKKFEDRVKKIVSDFKTPPPRKPKEKP